jgi:hypothetical protein
MTRLALLAARTRFQALKLSGLDVLEGFTFGPRLVMPGGDQVLNAWAVLEHADLQKLADAHAAGAGIVTLAEGQVRDLASSARFRWRRLVNRSVGYQYPGGPVRSWSEPRPWTSPAVWTDAEAADFERYERRRALELESWGLADAPPGSIVRAGERVYIL